MAEYDEPRSAPIDRIPRAEKLERLRELAYPRWGKGAVPTASDADPFIAGRASV